MSQPTYSCSFFVMCLEELKGSVKTLYQLVSLKAVT